MKWLSLLLLVCTLSATTVTGTVRNADRTAFNGYILFNLLYPGQDTVNDNVVGTGTVRANVVGGLLYQTSIIPLQGSPTNTGITLTGNDTISPANTIYMARFFDNSGGFLWALGYSITGSTFDIGNSPPTPITSQYVAVLDLFGMRTISVKQLYQPAANYYSGTCTMAGGTSCSQNVSAIYTSTPVCVASEQGTDTKTAACSYSAGAVTVTASGSNSDKWGFVLIGNPN